MEHITLFKLVGMLLLGVALSMDASAVSIVYGANNRPFAWRRCILPSLAFAIAQAVMPCIGWLGGELVADFVRAVDHWIAFVILAAIGIKFIFDSRKGEDEQKSPDVPFLALMGAALATSIDACVVGVTIRFADDPLFIAAPIIGAVTFINCFLCSRLGARLGEKFGPKLLIIGGIVLILLGTKILVTDLFFQ